MAGRRGAREHRGAVDCREEAFRPYGEVNEVHSTFVHWVGIDRSANRTDVMLRVSRHDPSNDVRCASLTSNLRRPKFFGAFRAHADREIGELTTAASAFAKNSHATPTIFFGPHGRGSMNVGEGDAASRSHIVDEHMQPVSSPGRHGREDLAVDTERREVEVRSLARRGRDSEWRPHGGHLSLRVDRRVFDGR